MFSTDERKEEEEMFSTNLKKIAVALINCNLFQMNKPKILKDSHVFILYPVNIN